LRFIDYIKDKILVLIMNIFGMILLAGFLLATGYPGGNILLILVVWIFTLSVTSFINFYLRRSYFHKLFTVLDGLDKRYLIGEVMEVTHRLEDQIYREIICKSNKAVIERINQIEDEQNEYREYIETWIHEVKAPLTAIYLMCGSGEIAGQARNDDDGLGAGVQTRDDGLGVGEQTRDDRLGEGEQTRDDESTFLLQLKKLENYIDLALFYARSDDVYKDYLIKETDLEQVVVNVLREDKLIFTRNQFSIDVDVTEKVVYTDAKWVQFVLRQVLLNCVKYRGGIAQLASARCWQARNDELEEWIASSKAPRNDELAEGNFVRIYTHAKKNAVNLIIEDNGIGIPESELSRIFDKGFTGSNGRRGANTDGVQKSTGIGLYLCKKLCDKMGIGISAESIEGKFTRITLTFPTNKHHEM